MLHRLEDVLARGVLSASSSTAVKLLNLPSSGGCLIAYGTSVPSAVAGYVLGAIFIHTDGAAATAVYRNVGSSTSCTFVEISQFDSLSPVTAGGAINVTGVVLQNSNMTCSNITVSGSISGTNSHNLGGVNLASSNIGCSNINASGTITATNTQNLGGVNLASSNVGCSGINASGPITLKNSNINFVISSNITSYTNVAATENPQMTIRSATTNTAVPYGWVPALKVGTVQHYFLSCTQPNP